ncbi:response regulator transcription factor [Oceanirhabdus sp. W0125-5]|uniref:response regulator transcription factor n=1 Tax=Oceanirhabdus sp. W0125-5 TaxID=2999116 RepID=UPI0022F306EF|nr:response regulator transcription factor [Oceanirhabdus sp. W0125-5]WBW95600.1 response regulator transcription factor [Oceanirhabdus sp. W0125-5]
MNKKILIIEDEISIAELEKDYLEINEYKVEMEHTGTEGLKNALSNRYDLIILDVMLPDINGFEICKKIREESNVPLLMVSARGEDIDKIRGLGLGADDYITKPFSPNELVARVKAHIARYNRLVEERNEPKDLSIRGLNINLEARRVTVNGKEIIFTTKEYDLLLFLAENPDRVFSKEILFDRVWGMDNYGDIATVTVHIGKIRDKIEKDTSNPQYIETIWGVGYRFKI